MVASTTVPKLSARVTNGGSSTSSCQLGTKLSDAPNNRLFEIPNSLWPYGQLIRCSTGILRPVDRELLNPRRTRHCPGTPQHSCLTSLDVSLHLGMAPHSSRAMTTADAPPTPVEPTVPKRPKSGRHLHRQPVHLRAECASDAPREWVRPAREDSYRIQGVQLIDNVREALQLLVFQVLSSSAKSLLIECPPQSRQNLRDCFDVLSQVPDVSP